MNITKVIIGMSKWKKRMAKMADKPAYTAEWWNECIDAVEFMPQEYRKGFIKAFVETCFNFNHL